MANYPESYYDLPEIARKEFYDNNFDSLKVFEWESYYKEHVDCVFKGCDNGNNSKDALTIELPVTGVIIAAIAIIVCVLACF